MGSGESVQVPEIKNALLCRLYHALFAGCDRLLVTDIRREQGWNERRFWRALEDLVAEDLAKGLDSGPNYAITPAGVIDLEKRGLVRVELVKVNNQARVEILQRYAAVYETEGREGDCHYRQVAAEVVSATGLDEEVVEANQDFLIDAGYLVSGSIGFFRLAAHAVEALQDWQGRTRLDDALQSLRESTDPKGRGRQFETLIGDFAEASGWMLDRNVIGPGEEIDIVLNRDDSFYLLECRWWNEPVGAKEIRDFEGKLRKRAGVQGVLVSMSGFTVDATCEVEAVTGETPMVLFGPEDVASLFAGSTTLVAALTEKKRRLVLNRRAPWR